MDQPVIFVLAFAIAIDVTNASAASSCNLDNPLCMTAWVAALILAVVYILQNNNVV